MTSDVIKTVSAVVADAISEALTCCQENEVAMARPYDKVFYTRKDIEERYQVKTAMALQIMREAKFLCGGEGYNGKLGKGKLHYSELAVWDRSLAASKVTSSVLTRRTSQ